MEIDTGVVTTEEVEVTGEGGVRESKRILISTKEEKSRRFERRTPKKQNRWRTSCRRK